jgi:hypothetical protein
MSSKAFSPEVVRLGSGFLSKEKTKAGMVIRGLERNFSGGLIESIIQIKNINSAADPAHPAHPSPKRQNLVTEQVSAVKGQQAHPALLCNNTVQGVARLNAHPSPTLHHTQSHKGATFQPFQNPLVKGVQGQEENLRDREKIGIAIENDTANELKGWIECHTAKPYPNPHSNNIHSSQKRALSIRKAYQAARSKEDLSALRRENGGKYTKGEHNFVHNWLANFFPEELAHVEALCRIEQSKLFDID